VACLQHDAAYQYDADISATRRSQADTDIDTDTSSTEGGGYEALISADMDHLRPVSRQEAYACDVLFGTNNEFGFDYLRDNMVQQSEDRVQRGLHFAMIDEVDSILIDEARTPLIISGPAQEPTQQYYQFAQLVQQLQPQEHFTVDEKMRSVALTDAGIASLEKSLGVDNLYVSTGLRTVHHIEQALKARLLFLKDRDYVVQEQEVIIIDEFTGRMMQGRRYSEGLHQAIEAKEGLPIKQESQTLATITLQNFFRLYEKLSGMTGTASTEAEELHKIYGLDVVTIPSHREMIRIDLSDRVYKNTQAKYRAVVEEIKNIHETGRPILVGTISIEHNEILSELLTANGIKHVVLNAKQHEKEGKISLTFTNLVNPTILVLSSYNPVLWSINDSDIDKIQAIFVYSYG
jgi:preprotein translocase subunit SecA